MVQGKKITILTGHFGSGKTEIAINLALKEKHEHSKVAISDLDVINPYFRTRDARELFRKNNIELIAPKDRLANSDLPVVSGEIYRVIHDPSYKVIVDAGGDKDGATALGQYFNDWEQFKPEVLFVLNANRPYVSTVEGASFTVKQIEKASRLKVTGIINNSNIGSFTSMEEIICGLDLSKELSNLLNIPLLYTCISSQLRQEAEMFQSTNETIFIERYMKVPWEA